MPQIGLIIPPFRLPFTSVISFQTIWQLNLHHACKWAPFLRDATDNDKNETHSEPNAPSTVCWTRRFFCPLTTRWINGSSLLPRLEGGQTNTGASAFTVICPSLYCTPRSVWGAWGRYYTMYCIPMSSKSGAEKEIHTFLGKKNKRTFRAGDGDAGRGVSPTRGGKRKASLW